MAAAQQLMAQGTSTTDSPIVPLWESRPAAPRTGGAGSSAAAEYDAGTPGAGSANAAEYDASQQPAYQAPLDVRTKSYAESHWLDMSIQERQAFATKAQQAGLWKPTQGAEALGQAWVKSVNDAYQYNANHDKSAWISPFEAVQMLGAQNLADANGTFNGYAKTQEIIHQFNVNELYGQAEQILQKELGRSPTDSEMKAYTAAVNHAAAMNPVTMTEAGSTPSDQIDPTTGAPLVADTQKVYSGGGPYSAYDPTKTIEDMVRATPEHAQYQAAVDYFPAVMQALGAVVQ